MRLFIATSFPTEVIDDLNARVSRLKPRLPAASWVRAEVQHFTFAFIGEQPEALVDELAPALTGALHATPPFEASLHGSGFFPNPRHARVGWIGLEPEAKFVAIATIVRDVVTKNRVTLDAADFKPHLTLMRIRDRWPPASIDLFSTSLRDYHSAPFDVASVTLYSSQLHPKGAIHTPLRNFPLAVS